jgi:hypothetical protein
MPFVIGVMGVGGPVEKYSPRQQRYSGIHRNFRRAMAAPATLPDFQGNVAAVLTEEYWDAEFVRLREREAEIKQKLRGLREAGKLSREQEAEALQVQRAEVFTPHEIEVLTKSTSNFDFHYMGSAKIMAQIGKGFAEAMAELVDKSGSPQE